MLSSQYFYNIFITNHRWLVIINSNLNLTLRITFFTSIIITSNNLSLIIYCKNIVDIYFFLKNNRKSRSSKVRTTLIKRNGRNERFSAENPLYHG